MCELPYSGSYHTVGVTILWELPYCGNCHTITITFFFHVRKIFDYCDFNFSL